jgi:carnitine 3-dehydrogenase
VSDLPESAGLLGGGVIGGGWAARFLLAGVDVTVYDPDPDAPAKVGRLLENARRAYDKLTVLPLPPEGTLTFVSSAEEAVAGAAFVQESAPQRLELKQRLLAAASAAAGPEVVICSSTSGLRPSVLALEMDHPERFVVGHPFDPVYLLPLVELCAGRATSPSAVERAAAVYRALGMHPLTLRHEIEGLIADRLLEALWREALRLVHDDVASVAEIDDAISYGDGLRWAIMGTFLEKIADRSDAQAQGRPVPELERERDDALVGVLQALRARGVGAGATVGAWERRLLDVVPAPVTGSPDNDRPTPLKLYAREIPADWIDYNGHVTESRYLDLLGQATDALLRYIGVDATYISAGGSYYTVETHISHLGQLYAGDRVQAATQVLGFDDKRLHLFHVITRVGEDTRVATGEHMLVHVDAAAGRASAVRDGVRERAQSLADAHASLPRPVRAGRRIAL